MARSVAVLVRVARERWCTVLCRDAAVHRRDRPWLPDIVRPGNMVMDNDAQKVIAISLGKIATSRVQRGGPSLHRSLLVASVLYKARTTYFDDALQANGASPVMCAHDDISSETASGEASGDSAPVAKPNRTVTSCVTYEDCASTDGGDDKENVEPDCASPRCPKRRRTHSDDDEGGGSSKRSRLWRRSSSFCESDEPELDCLLATTDFDQTQEVAAAAGADAMEVESISNLVLAFNTGLKGISSTWDNCHQSSEEPPPLLRRAAATSLPDLCSAHSEGLRTAFSAPVVALTV